MAKIQNYVCLKANGKLFHVPFSETRKFASYFDGFVHMLRRELPDNLYIKVSGVLKKKEILEATVSVYPIKRFLLLPVVSRNPCAEFYLHLTARYTFRIPKVEYSCDYDVISARNMERVKKLAKESHVTLELK